jgi:hypothetical protein
MAEKNIWQKMLSEFMRWQTSNQQYASFKRNVTNASATYEDAQEFAKCIAKKWSELLQNYVGIDVDLTSVTENEVESAIKQAIKHCYKLSSQFSARIQEIINKSINLNIKAIEGEIDPGRISNLIEKLREGRDVASDLLITPETQWLIELPVVENIARSAVTDTIQKNAELHTSAGIVSYIERKQGSGGCCDWCASVAGRYVYGEQPSNFFKVHKHCNCVITYMPSRERWKEITYSTDKKGVIKKNTTLL